MSVKINDIYQLKKDVKELQNAVPDIPEVDLTSYYTKTETDTKIATGVAGIVDSAPETLNTLKELSKALGDDPNFATTVATQLGNKADTNHSHSYADLEGAPPEVDLTGYYNKTEVDNKFVQKSEIAEITLNNYYNKKDIQNFIKEQNDIDNIIPPTEGYIDEEKSKYNSYSTFLKFKTLSTINLKTIDVKGQSNQSKKSIVTKDNILELIILKSDALYYTGEDYINDCKLFNLNTAESTSTLNGKQYSVYKTTNRANTTKEPSGRLKENTAIIYEEFTIAGDSQYRDHCGPYLGFKNSLDNSMFRIGKVSPNQTIQTGYPISSLGFINKPINLYEVSYGWFHYTHVLKDTFGGYDISKGNIVKISLPCDLQSNGDVYDEILNGELIQRIDANGEKMDTPIIHKLEDFNITLPIDDGVIVIVSGSNISELSAITSTINLRAKQEYIIDTMLYEKGNLQYHLKNTNDRVTELFQSVNSGKTNLETAIIDKGGEVSKVGQVATFQELIDAIKLLKIDDNVGKQIIIDAIKQQIPDCPLTVEDTWEKISFYISIVGNIKLNFNERITIGNVLLNVVGNESNEISKHDLLEITVNESINLESVLNNIDAIETVQVELT